MRKHLFKVTLSVIITLIVLVSVVDSRLYSQISQGLNPPSNQSYVAGRFVARNYVYNGIRIATGTSIPAGAGTIALTTASVRLPDGRTIVPFGGGFSSSGQAGPYPYLPISVGAGSTQETVTPTAISGCYVGAPNGNCKITATFNNAHGQGEVVTSSTAGIAEAGLDAASYGGGTVVVDQSLNQITGTYAALSADIVAAPVMPTVTIEDDRSGVPRFWAPTPTGAALAVPTTLTSQAACDATHQFCSDASVAGSASWGSTVYGCVAYVDIMGNEGPCSLTSTVFTSVASKAIDVAAPAASSGAVGYVVYLSLSGGTYAQAYQIPSTSSNCTLTTLETATPACAVTNTSYGQVGSTFGAGGLFTKGGSQITTYPVNTGQHFTKLASTVQTTASYTPVSNSSLTYAYAPSNRVGICPGMSSANVSQYAAGASSTTGIPMAVATWTVPAGCFNYIGAEFRVSGKFTWTDGGAADTFVTTVGWDAAGTNTTTVPTTLCAITNAHTAAAAAQNGYYSCIVKVATAGATGTALANGTGFFVIASGQALLIGNGNDTAVAASGSINLTAPARITVQFTDTGATANPGAQGLAASLEVLN